jgi:3-oxoacyl-[acyl-carrier protein] reductase
MTSYYSLEDQENYRQTVPLKRLATPLDIANAVYFLASDDAAFISGQTLFVNGGTQTH